MNDPKNHQKDDETRTNPEEPEHNDSPEEETKPPLTEQNAILSHINDLMKGPFLTNLLLAGLFSISIFIFYNDYNTTHRFSSLLMMIQVCCVVLFFLIRVAPAKVSIKPMDWTMAILGTCLPMLIAPVSAEHEIALFMLLQLIGILIGIIAIVSLNTSFAIVPALREVKTGGLYNIIRHPIYFGYFLTFTCVVLQNFSLLNLIVLMALYATDIYRIKAEEKVLSEDPGYELYKTRVHWRIIPFVW